MEWFLWRSSQVWPSLIIQTSWHCHALPSLQNCPWFVFIAQPVPTPFPAISSEPQLFCLRSSFLPSDLVSEIFLSLCPYTLELSPHGNRPVLIFAILPDSCLHSSVVVVFAPFRFVWSCLIFNSTCWFPFVLGFVLVPSLFCLVYLGIPLIYCSILGFAWLLPNVINK